jgi:hypothetical protein
MSLKSDITVDASKFDRANIDKETAEFNEKLIKIWADGPRWYEVRCAFTIIRAVAVPHIGVVSKLLILTVPPQPSYFNRLCIDHPSCQPLSFFLSVWLPHNSLYQQSFTPITIHFIYNPLHQ